MGFGRGVDPPAPQRRFHRTLDLERIKQAADAIPREEPHRAGLADQALWLAKFPAPADSWNQPRVEHGLLLLLARRCGLQVAESRLTRIGDADLLLADELRRVSAQPAADLRELFGRICFNAAVSNIDDHPRNHALLARSRSWQLSPAYDLTPAPLQAETRRWANRRAILPAAGRFLLQPAEADAIATRIFTAVTSSWEASLREASVSPGDCQRLSRAFLYPWLKLDPEVAE